MEKELNSLESKVRLWKLKTEKKYDEPSPQTPSSNPRVDCSVVHESSERKSKK